MSLPQPQKTAFNYFNTLTTRLAARLIHYSQLGISLAAVEWAFGSQGDGADGDRKILLDPHQVE